MQEAAQRSSDPFAAATELTVSACALCRLSFDTPAMVAKGKKFIRLYKEKGVDSSRVLIKLPCTWEGIRAGEILEKEGQTQRTTAVASLACSRLDPHCFLCLLLV